MTNLFALAILIQAVQTNLPHTIFLPHLVLCQGTPAEQRILGSMLTNHTLKFTCSPTKRETKASAGTLHPFRFQCSTNLKDWVEMPEPIRVVPGGSVWYRLADGEGAYW